METKILQVENIEAAELLRSFERIENAIKGLTFEPPKEKTDLLTREQVAQMLKISKVTLFLWTKKGYLKSYKIANKVYYKENEVNAALTHIKTVS
jgi:phage antirepressor YoqD-like protein